MYTCSYNFDMYEQLTTSQNNDANQLKHLVGTPLFFPPLPHDGPRTMAVAVRVPPADGSSQITQLLVDTNFLLFLCGRFVLHFSVSFDISSAECGPTNEIRVVDGGSLQLALFTIHPESQVFFLKFLRSLDVIVRVTSFCFRNQVREDKTFHGKTVNLC